MLLQLALAGFLLAHAAIHVAFLAPAPPATAGGPAWPFATTHSWLFTKHGVSRGAAQLLATALVATTIADFVVAALSSIGILTAAIWLPATVIGSVSSIVLLVAFFHPWLVLGIGIDLVLLWAGVVAGWTPTAAGSPV